MISPQGYTYGEDPKSDNPFWDDEETGALTATATVDESTGTPAVEVTKTGTNINFAFSGIKGEQGEQGIQGATGATGPQGPQGETGATGATGAQGPAGENGQSPTVVSTGATGSGEAAGTITGADGTVITVYNGAQGEAGEAGASGSTEGLVSDVSVSNENGVYTISQTKDGATTSVGTIEVPDVDTTNVLAEVTDSVVENNSWGYDFHTFKETEYNGTQNDVGKFYIAQKQVLGLTTTTDGTVIGASYVDQSGNLSSAQYNFNAETKVTQAIDLTYVPSQTVTVTGKNAGTSVTATLNYNSDYYLGASNSDGQYATGSFRLQAWGKYNSPTVTLTISNGSSAYVMVKYISALVPSDSSNYFVSQFFYASSSNLYQLTKEGWMIFKITATDSGDDCIYTIQPALLYYGVLSDSTLFLLKGDTNAPFNIE